MRSNNSIFYIYIPKDVDRDYFVAQCCNSGTVSIISELFEVRNNVRIGYNVLQAIKFPKRSSELGSMVLATYMPQYGTYLVTDTFTKGDETWGIDENEFLMEKDYEGNSVSVSGNAKSGDVSISASTDEGGNLNISITGDSSSSLNIKSSGFLRVDVDNDATINLKGKLDLNCEKEISVETEEVMTITSVKELIANVKSLKVNDGDLSVVTEKLVDVFSDFLTSYDTHTHTAPSGATTPPLVPQSPLLKTRATQSKSTVLYVDK